MSVDSVRVGFGRRGVEAGVSVGIVTGEELGEGLRWMRSSSRYWGMVFVGRGAGVGAEVLDCKDSEAGSSVAVAFPRPRPLPLAVPRAALGGMILVEFSTRSCASIPCILQEASIRQRRWLRKSTWVWMSKLVGDIYFLTALRRTHLNCKLASRDDNNNAICT